MSIIIILHVNSIFHKSALWYSLRWGGHEERSMVQRLQTQLLQGRKLHMIMGKRSPYFKNVNRTWTISEVQMESYLQ